MIVRAAGALVGAAQWGCFACFAAFCALTLVQVVNRYALGLPMFWTEEVVLLLFVWSVLLGLQAHVVRQSDHLGLGANADPRGRRDHGGAGDGTEGGATRRRCGRSHVEVSSSFVPGRAGARPRARHSATKRAARQSCAISNNLVAPRGTFMSSLENGLKTLALFTESRRRLRVTDVAEALALPKSSASRLLACLGEHGFLERVPQAQGYEVGYQLQRLASLSHTREMPLELAEAALRDLVSRHPVTGYIARLEGTETIILRVRESPHPIRYVVSEGTRLPAYVTAIGKSLLMRLDDARLLELLPARPSWPALNFATTRAALLRDLARCRALGIAVCYMERDVAARDRARIARDLVSLGRDIGARIGDSFWQARPAGATARSAPRRA